MRLINYIFRGIVFFIISFAFAFCTYLATIVCMLFLNWDSEFETLKTIHNDIIKFWLDTTFPEREREF